MKARYRLLLICGLLVASALLWIKTAASPGSSTGVWWDLDWHYRIRIDVASGSLPRDDEAIAFAVDLQSQLSVWDVPGTLDADSVCVVDQTGPCREVLSQYEPASNEVIWLSGVMSRDSIKTFYIYFDALENGSKRPPSYYEDRQDGGVKLRPTGDHLVVVYKIGGIEHEVASINRAQGRIDYLKPPLGQTLIDTEGSGINFEAWDTAPAGGPAPAHPEISPEGFSLSGGPVRSLIAILDSPENPLSETVPLERTYTFYYTPNGHDVRIRLDTQAGTESGSHPVSALGELQASVELRGAYAPGFDTVFWAAAEDAAALYTTSVQGLGIDQQHVSPHSLSDNYWGAYGEKGGISVIHSDPEWHAWKWEKSGKEGHFVLRATCSPGLDCSGQGIQEWSVWLYGSAEDDWLPARDFGNCIQAPAAVKAHLVENLMIPEDLAETGEPDMPLRIRSAPINGIEDDHIPIDRINGQLRVAWFSPSWSYRKSHSLSGSTAGLLTNYAVRFVVHYGSGTDSGEDVYLDGNCRADFGDVRFTNVDASVLFDYWIEEKTDGADAVFWVEIDSLPASPGFSNVYLYYGNASAVSSSNGKATFDWFDDFSFDSSTDYEIGRHTTVWHGPSVYNPYYDPVNQRVAYDTGDNFTGGWKVRSPNLLIQNFAAKVTFGVTGSYPINTTNGILGRWTGDSAYYGFYVAGGNYTAPALVRDARTTVIAAPGGNSYHPFGGIPHTSELRVYGSSLEGIYNQGEADEVVLAATDSSHAGAGQVEVIIAQAAGWFDVFFVRKYVIPEPSHGSWGSEEGAPSYLRVTGSATMDAGASNELTITAYDQFDTVATSYSGPKSFNFSGPGIAPDGTAPTVEGIDGGSAVAVNFTNGESDVAAATLIAYLAETTTVDVSDGTIDSNGSPTYDLDLLVSPGVLDNLVFGQQPTDTSAAMAIAPPVIVEVQDQWNNICTSDNSTSVSLAIDNNPGGGTLSGTYLRTALSGIAAFDDLSINLVGIGYTLQATSPGLMSVTSLPFSVSAGAAVGIVIEDASDGSGAEVDTRSLSTGQRFTAYAISRDAPGNYVDNVAVSWSLVDITGGIVVGDLREAPDYRSATFTANAGGTARIFIRQATLGTDTSGLITVRNRPPVAVAGEDRSIILGETVYLDGSASYDPDGDPLTYRWSFLSRPPESNAEIDDSESALCSFFPEHWGEYMLQLIVNDGREDSAPDEVRVYVQAPPVALFECTPISGLIPLEVSFDASASYDPDGRIVSYAWDCGDGTAGQGVNHKHTYTTKGEYTVVLTVVDNHGLKDTEAMSILARTLHPPVNVSLKREINRSLFKQEAFHTINWAPHPGNSGLNVVAYRVYRKEASAGDDRFQMIKALSGSTLSYVDGFLDVDKKYVYVVTSVEQSGAESQRSSPVGN